MKNRTTYKILGLAIIFCMIFSSAIASADTISFTDIEGSWAKDNILKVAKAGIIKGGTDGKFRPKDNVTQLEAIIMLSRLYKIDDNSKKKIVDKYSDFVKNNVDSKYSWAYNELPIAIALNVITEDALKALNDKNLLSEHATKEQVAVYLTKAMMLKDEADKIKGTIYTLPFKDTNEIGTKTRPYIYVMYNKKVLSGDTEGNVNPNSKITREVFAKMVSVAYDYINENNIKPVLPSFEVYNTVKGIVTAVTFNSVESYLDIEVETTKETMVVRMSSEKTNVKINNKTSDIDKLEKGMFVECEVAESTGIAKTITVDTNVTFVEGIIKSVYFVSPQKLVIYDKINSSKETTYNISNDVEVTLDGLNIDMKNLVKSDIVKLKLIDDKVVQIDSISRIKTYTGKIKNIVFDIPITMSIEDEKGKSYNFTYNEEPSISRNDGDATFDQLRIGDTVTVKTEYDVLIAIDATSTTTVADKIGIIKEITIGAQNRIKVQDEEGIISEYKINGNARFSVFDATASIYDLRIGYRVALSFDGEEIMSVDAKNDDTSQELSGKVIYVNPEKKTVILKISNEFGQSEIITLNLNVKTKIISLTGRIKYIKDLKAGDSIISIGTYSGGNFDAISIIIK